MTIFWPRPEVVIISDNYCTECGTIQNLFPSQADELYTHVDDPTAAILDARLVAQLSRICRQQGEGLSTNAQAGHHSVGNNEAKSVAGNQGC